MAAAERPTATRAAARRTARSDRLQSPAPRRRHLASARRTVGCRAAGPRAEMGRQMARQTGRRERCRCRAVGRREAVASEAAQGCPRPRRRRWQRQRRRRQIPWRLLEVIVVRPQGRSRWWMAWPRRRCCETSPSTSASRPPQSASRCRRALRRWGCRAAARSHRAGRPSGRARAPRMSSGGRVAVRRCAESARHGGRTAARLGGKEGRGAAVGFYSVQTTPPPRTTTPPPPRSLLTPRHHGGQQLFSWCAPAVPSHVWLPLRTIFLCEARALWRKAEGWPTR